MFSHLWDQFTYVLTSSQIFGEIRSDRGGNKKLSEGESLENYEKIDLQSQKQAKRIQKWFQPSRNTISGS